MPMAATRTIPTRAPVYAAQGQQPTYVYVQQPPQVIYVHQAPMSYTQPPAGAARVIYREGPMQVVPAQYESVTSLLSTCVAEVQARAVHEERASQQVV